MSAFWKIKSNIRVTGIVDTSDASDFVLSMSPSSVLRSLKGEL